MSKIGRNQPCTCGSGKKFKHCHGSVSPAVSPAVPTELWDWIERKRQEREALELRRKQQQGLGRPIISSQVSGGRVVVVGGRLYRSTQWLTFQDFLKDYLLASLGPEWANAEQVKPVEERHLILRWYAQASEQAEALRVADGTMVSGPMTGAMRAFMNLAYNIYLIAHHGDGQAMADIFLRRLRSSRADDFTGALFETYAAAAFLKAGFKLRYEETAHRSTSCVEFVATWPETGQLFSVEVKSRLPRAGAAMRVEDPNEARRLRVGAKLVKALSKAADHTRVVMIEVNVPGLVTEGDQFARWTAAAVSEIRGNETATMSNGSLYPPAYVFVTNHAFHHDLTGTSGGTQVVADGFRISDFGPTVRYGGYRELLAARERHAPMMALIASMRTHYEIPATFDGDLPGTLVAPAPAAHLRVGEQYLVPDGCGGEVPGRLESANVLENEKLVYGIYKLDSGQRVIATSPLTEEELNDYRRYPDTFFGVVMPVAVKVKTFVDKCDLLLSVYKNSTRAQLLEFMADAPDIEHLRALSQHDLAVIYCLSRLLRC